MTKVEYEQAMADSHGRGFGQDEINFRIALREKYIASLEKENEALKSQAIVWHKYPDEKPEQKQMPSHESYMLLAIVKAHSVEMVLVQDAEAILHRRMVDYRYCMPEQIMYWAYLHEPPKEES